MFFFHTKFAVIGVEPAVKYSFVLKGMQTRRKGQYIEDITRWREDMNFVFEWQEQ